MQPNISHQHQFYLYLFQKIVQEGGLRLQLIASEVANDLQKQFPPKHALNLHRKQFGNIFEVLKTLPHPFYDLDNMVIRMKKPQVIRTMKIPAELMELYENKLKENRIKEIQIMKINHENQCSRCGEVYNVNVTGKKSCSGQPHHPKY